MIAGVQFMSLLRRKDTAFVPAEHRTTNTFAVSVNLLKNYSTL